MFKRIFSIVLMLAVMCSAFSFTAFAEDQPAAETNPLDDFYPTEDKTVYITGNLVAKCGGLDVTYSAYERTVNIKDKWARTENKGAAVSYISSDGEVSLPQDYTDIFVTASVTDGTNTYTKDYPMTLTPRGAITYFNDGFENESVSNTNNKWTIVKGTSSGADSSTAIESDTDINSKCLYMVQKSSTGKNQDTVSAEIDSAAKDVDVDSGDIITYFAFKYKYGYQYNSSIASRKALYIAPFIKMVGDPGENDSNDKGKLRYYLTGDSNSGFFSQETTPIDFKYTKYSNTWHDVAISVDGSNFGMTFDKQQTSPYYKYDTTNKFNGTEAYSPMTSKISLGSQILIKFDGTSQAAQQKIDDIILQTITKQQVAQNAIDAYELNPFSGTGENQTLTLPTTLEAGFGKTAAVTWALKNTADASKLEINTDTATPKVFDGSKVTLTATAKIDDKYTATKDFEVTLSEICGYFGISDIKLVKADGTTEISIPENNAKVSSVKVTKYQELPEETTAKLYTAVYKTTGALSKCKVTDIDLNGFSATDNSQTINPDLEVDENDGTVKCFIWNNDLEPLGKSEQSRKTKLFVCGDSIHCAYPRNLGNNSSDNYKYGIGEFLGSHFDSERLEVVNCAKSGDSTKLFRDNSWTEKVEKNLCYGDYIYISFGHNDNNMSDPDRKKQVTEADYKANLKFFAESAKAKGANVVFVTPLSRLCKSTDVDAEGVVDGDAAIRDGLRSYADYMKAVGEAINVPVVDLNKLSQDYLDTNYDDAKKCYLITDRPTSGDKTHLTKFGAETYAKMVTDELKKINHPLSKIMK